MAGSGRYPILEPADPGLGRSNLLAVRHERLLVGFAQCSTDQQDQTAQHDALLSLGVEADRIYVNHGLTGTNRDDLNPAKPSPHVALETRWWH